MGERGLRILFWSVIVLGIVDRVHLLQLTIGHASNDLAVIWSAARDQSQGLYHEPFFYGQNYGVMLEAFIAAPFVAVGIDPVMAVAVAIAFLAMVPFWSFAFFHARRAGYLQALFFACVPLLLPVEHGLNQTALNGIAVLALFPWVRSVRPVPLGSVLLGLVLSAAVFVNPNALLMAVPLGTFVLLKKPRSWTTWVAMACGTLPVLLAWWWAQRLYFSEPQRLVNTIFDWRMTFHPELIAEASGQLGRHFAWLAPVVWSHGPLILWATMALIIPSFRQRKEALAWALVAAILIIVSSLGFPKTHDGTDSIFFPLSRMFLVMPLLFTWAVAELIGDRHLGRWIPIGLGMITLFSMVVRSATGASTFKDALAHQDGIPLSMRPVSSLRGDCAALARTAKATAADMIVLFRSPDAYTAHFLAYGGPALETGLPPTYIPEGDRRAWQKTEAGRALPRKILFVNGDQERWQKAMAADTSIHSLPNDPFTLHVMSSAAMPVDILVQRMGLIDPPL